MTGTQILTFATLAVACCVVVALVLIGVPRLARLLFRQRLESIRDDCMDAIFDGRLRRAVPVDEFLTAVESTRKRAQWITLPRAIAAYNAYHDLDFNMVDLATEPSYAGLRPGEERVMRSLEARAESAFKAYLQWGSPAGWILAPLMLIRSRLHPSSKPGMTEDALNLARGAVLSPRGDYPVAALFTSRAEAHHVAARTRIGMGGGL
jgi:hypothetical protein